MSIEDIIDETILIGAKSMTGFDDDDIDSLDYLEEDDPLRQQWESARNMVIDKISESLLNLQEQYKARQKWDKSDKKVSETTEMIHVEITNDIDTNSTTLTFDSELWILGLKFGAMYLQQGTNNFADWSRKMTSKIGIEISSQLTKIWQTLGSYPESTKFDEKQMTMITKIIVNLYSDGITNLKEIKSSFVKEFGKDMTKQIEPMIDACFNGIVFCGVKIRRKKSSKTLRK